MKNNVLVLYDETGKVVHMEVDENNELGKLAPKGLAMRANRSDVAYGQFWYGADPLTKVLWKFRVTIETQAGWED